MELCKDVRNLIIERMEKSEDMVLVVVNNAVPHNVLFYTYRNMKDPQHHVRFTVYDEESKKETSVLLRTKEALMRMVKDQLNSLNPMNTNVFSIYIQGASKPPSMYIDWRANEQEDNPYQMVAKNPYVWNNMPCFHHVDISKGYSTVQHLQQNDICDRIVSLVSTN